MFLFASSNAARLTVVFPFDVICNFVAKYSEVKDFWEPSSDSLFADTVWFAVQTDDIAVFSSTSVLDCMGNVDEV